MSLLCTLKNLNLSFAGKVLFEGASLNISFQDRIGLLGLNGKGKSSLFKVLTEQVKPDHSVPPFQFDKARGDHDPAKAYSVFLVPQEITHDKSDNPTLKEFIFNFYPELKKIHRELEEINLKLATDQSEKLLNRQKDLLEKYEHLGAWELTQSYESYLKYFSLDDHSKRIHDLSGGEQKKALLALGLSTKATLVLWDEPTNHLDLETIKVFEEELMNSSKTFVVISHDRYLLSKLCNKIFHINRGRIESFNGSYEDYLRFLSESEEARKKELARLSNSLRRETAWMRQGIKARGTRSKKRVENYHDIKKSISTLKDQTKREVQLSLHHSNRKTKILVESTDMSFSYDDKNLFNDVSVKVCKGDKIGLIGRNGVGKSTLLNLLRGELAPASGRVKQADDLKIQYFSQKRDELDPEKTPFDILGDGTDTVFLPTGHKMHVNGYFESFLFNKDQVHRPLKTFSGGEKNRLQLAINLLRDGDIWIFDEPTNDLDLETLTILEKKLAEFKGALILISHDRSFLANVTNKVWLLDKKKVESFEVGYEQAEPYLEATALEHILLDSEQESVEEEKETIKIEDVTGTDSESVIKLSNQEKERLKKIPYQIDVLERELENVEKAVSAFDFSTMNDEKGQEFSQLTQRQELIEEKLFELYEEKEELETRDI